MTAIPSIAEYRGCPIHDFQDAARIENIVRPAIDRVFALSAAGDLLRYACDKTQPPEARLLAGARLQAQHEQRAGQHEQRPSGLEHVRAALAGLKSFDWVDVHYYGTSLQPHAPGETRVPRAPEHRDRLREALECLQNG